jgi:peroxiredoxin
MNRVDLKGTIFTDLLVYRRTERWILLGDDEKRSVPDELDAVFRRYEGTVDVRGIYSGAGFRTDADVALWVLSESFDEIQNLVVDIRRTTFGRTMEESWAFAGLTRPPEFVGDHYASFQKGLPPRKYLCAYPFVRSLEWYLLPKEERGAMLREHGLMGREFPEVQTNNVQAFGLGDYEWFLAFETDQLERFVDLVRRLREAKARLHTKQETPFILGIRKETPQVIRDLA